MNTRGWKKMGAAVVTAAAIWAIEAPAADFIRGDANGDGRLTLADVALANGYMFFGTDLACAAAADSDDDGGISLGDLIHLERYLLGAGAPPPSPYPGAGPDTTGAPDWEGNGCESYESIPSLEDPAAAIRIHDAVAPGGDDVHAVIRVSIAHSVPIWSFFGAVEIGAGLVEDLEILGKDEAIEHFLEGEAMGPNGEGIAPNSSSRTRTQVKDGRLQFGIPVHAAFGLPPRDETEVLTFRSSSSSAFQVVVRPLSRARRGAR